MFGKPTEILILAAIAALTPSAAFAYIEPGTGAMVLQIVLGGVAGIAVVWKLFWHRLKEIFVPGFKQASGNDDSGSSESESADQKD